MLKLALISKWFIHAERFANYIKNYPECEIEAVYDYDRDRGAAWAKEIGCAYVDDYDQILSNPEIHGVVIMVPVKMHKEYILKAADAKKHIFVEKPLAGSLQDAYEIRDAVMRNKVHFIVSDPVKKPPLLYAKQLMDKGELGKITVVRSRITTDELTKAPFSNWRKSHTGEEMCGGDLIDIGHHSVHILHWLLGKPERTVSMYSQVTEFAREDETEDNAVAVFGYPDGAIGISESGSATKGNLYEFEIFGTKGCIQGTKKQLRYCIENHLWENVPEEKLPQPYEYILYYWIRNIVEDRPDEMFGIQESLEVLEMIMAAYKAGKNTQKIVYRDKRKERKQGEKNDPENRA